MRKPVLAAIVAIFLFAFALALSSCSRQYSGPIQQITVGTQNLEPALPLVIAEARQFFRRHGLLVTFKNYDTGLAAADGLLARETDVAVDVADYVLAAKALGGQSIQTIGAIDRDDYVFLAARADRGIHAVGDLQGKMIGVLRGTAQEFYLSRFLQLSGMDLHDVKPVAMTTLSDSADRMVKGEIDAVVSVDPYLAEIQAQFGEKVVTWPAQSSQPFYSLAVCRTEWVQGHAETIRRFLAAVSDAEDFILAHPDDAKLIAEKQMGFSREAVERFWPRNLFALSLDQSLVAAMEDEARWMIWRGLTAVAQVPDFTDFIHTDGLRAVKPDAVSIIQ